MAKQATFNSTTHVVEGWYWAARSRDVPRGRIRAVQVCGKELIVYRGDDGRVRALDAHCPHMGAHLAEGKVDGAGVRCFFHGWKLDERGCIVDVPCQERPPDAAIAAWPCEERYGLIWVYTGHEARGPIPFAPELKETGADARLGGAFTKGCHPNVVMVNAIDEQHFATVHNLPARLRFDIGELPEGAQTFDNATTIPTTSAFKRFLASFYAGPLTYRMCYWSGTNGTVTVGPDFFHFHILFALRPTHDGKTEGQTVLLTKPRPGPLGWVVNRVALFLTALVGDYFAHGDTRVFQTIRFDLKTPIVADRPIVKFMQYVDNQRAVSWGTWEPPHQLVAIARAKEAS